MYDATPVENMFINEYMPRADGAFVKVYLYGLMRCYHPEENTGVAAIAKALDMNEDSVLNAFEYWESMGLIRRISDSVPKYQYINILSKTTNEELEMDTYQFFNSHLQSLFGAKRLLRPKDFKTAHGWTEPPLKLPHEVIYKLIELNIEIRGNGFSLDKLDEEAAMLAQRGAKIAADVDDVLIVARAKKRGLDRVLQRLGRKSAPGWDDAVMFLDWIENKKFSLEAILEACQETTKGAPTMAYLDGILRRMHAKALDGQGVRGKVDVGTIIQRDREGKQKVGEVLRAMGIDTSPSEAWVKWYDKQKARGFTHGALMETAGKYSRAARKIDKFDEILDYFAGLSIFNAEDVATFYAQQKDQETKRKTEYGGRQSAQNANPRRSSKEVAEHRYDQRQYTDEELDSLVVTQYGEDFGG
jgi:hypothetical protein